MKALKEKRVSLRSLFRRSLVILSLLALAFAIASCSSDSGDSGGTTESKPQESQPGSQPVVVPDKPIVSDMTVISHPKNPSYEGAFPDLTGLEVLVKWNNGTSTIEDGSKFTVYPPVAFVSITGTHEALSPSGRYAIQYIGDDADYFSTQFRKNVYIPAVIAMDPTAGTVITAPTALTYITGEFKDVYEDQGIKGEFYFTSTYAAFDPATIFVGSNATNYWPADYNYVGTAGSTSFMEEKNSAGAWVTRKEWGTTTTACEHKSKISENPEAWRIDVRSAEIGNPNIATATYRADLNAWDIGEPAGNRHIIEVSKPIDKFYKVDKLVYIGGLDAIEPFAVDGDNVMTANTTLPIGEVVPTSQTAWLTKLLSKADDIKFDVIYYDNATPRRITMWDYYKAMYTVGMSPITNKLEVKATLPDLMGDPDVARTSGQTASAVQSLQEEYDLSLVLYYYNPLIEGKLGSGSIMGTYGTNGTYLESNGAILPVSDLLLTYADEMWVKPKSVTAQPAGEEYGIPYIISNWNTQYQGEQLYKKLQDYFDVGYVYVDKKGNRKEGDPIAWPNMNTNGTVANMGANGKSANGFGLTDSEFEPAEIDLDPRECTVEFPLPFSADTTRLDTYELNFNYKMQRN